MYRGICSRIRICSVCLCVFDACHLLSGLCRCIAEFFDQVSQANKQVRSAIPHSLQSATVYGVHTDNADALASCAAVVAQWRQKSTALTRELRPALGHQRNATALADLVRWMAVLHSFPVQLVVPHCVSRTIGFGPSSYCASCLSFRVECCRECTP